MKFIRVLLLILSAIPTLNLRSQVCINEYVSLNTNGILDEDHEYADWIELYNNSNSPADISGFGLSDDAAQPMRWTFPEAILPPHKHLVVFASLKDRKLLPMNFETIIDAGEDWRYFIPDSDIGSTWKDLNFDDSSWSSGSSGFGYSDGDDSTEISSSAFSLYIRKEFTVNDIATISRLVLSVDYDDGFVAYINGQEVARSNLGNPGENTPWDQLATNSHEATIYAGGAPEYFEISSPVSVLNEGTNVIAIEVHNNIVTSSDMTLTPFLTTGRMEGADDISEWLSFTNYGGLHTNFKMDADSERVWLSNQYGTIIDSTSPVKMLKDVSFGRCGDGSTTWKFFGVPTPGSANSHTGTEMIVADSVIFSPGGGIYASGLTVNLNSASGGNDSIFYTLDGSVPDRSDLLYAGPISVSSDKVIKARIIRYDRLPGPVNSRTFIIGPERNMPVIALSTDPFNLWDNLSGIYTFGPNTPTQAPFYEANYWREWERPVHIELYDADGVLQIDQDAGVKIFGGWSRTNPQKSLALFARSEYGKGSFKYKFFKTKPIEKFESIVLRNSGNDNMGLQFHDCFMTGLARDMEFDVQAYQPAAVYINGEYWGLLNIREKVSDHYVASNHIVDADSVNLLEYDAQVINGNNTGYQQLTAFMNLKTTLQNEADFKKVQDQIDIDNFIQYQLFNIYLNNRDWPGNNIKYWNTTAPGSKWRWIAFDTDFGFGIWDVNDFQINTLNFALEPAGPGWPNPPWSTLFLRRLVTNPGFRENFINQFCDRLNQDFLPSRINADLDSLKSLYSDEIQRTFDRWDASYDDWVCKYDGWLSRIDSRKVFGQNRPVYCRQHLQTRFQLSAQQNINVDVSDQNAGTVRLNSITIKSYPFTGTYFKYVPVKMTAIPKPGYKFTKWSGTVVSIEPQLSYNMAAGGTFKANFTPAAEEDISILINEINYHSCESLDTKDWVELYNNGKATVDLSGWLLIDNNVDSGYVFPAGTIMIPGSYLVICRNVKDFRSHNPNAGNSIGELTFKLSQEGDIVRLFDKNNKLIDAVNFGVILPWPAEANGTGKTLELRSPLLDNSHPESWQAIARGGTPGAMNSEDTVTNNITGPGAENVFDCFPNPFSDFTTIRFNAVQSGKYRLEVVDMQGRIAKVLSNSDLVPGTYWIDWDGEGSAGNGVYTIRLTGPQGVKTMKVVKW